MIELDIGMWISKTNSERIEYDAEKIDACI
jgi:hypothetical protein